MRTKLIVACVVLAAGFGFAAELFGDKVNTKSSRPAKITSETTFYDRKEGIVQFTGQVYVDDENYQMHSDKAYVFLEGTNELSRIVAIGNVALTNETRRAYGGKVSYYKDNGLVVLYSDDNIKAEVRDVKPEGDQIIRGEKIKFWINSEQVEVVKAEIEAPAQGKGIGGIVPGLNK